ncbi:hypothetical protein IFM89_019432 [Coptis chinensis]|uniref:Uncharacterized protein n=1 Tax=Coptis chinensis TaxID=261450 RepID=A0A835LJ50_9MAGN|nr:hypothetical protein IFM89_019432 [Coptis chinensis]
MDPKKSSLNSYASSYIPLSKRGKGSENRPTYVYPGNSVGDDKPSLTKHPAIHKRWIYENLNEESEMDLAILLSNYPGVSYQSIVNVYFVNTGLFIANMSTVPLAPSHVVLEESHIFDQGSGRPVFMPREDDVLLLGVCECAGGVVWFVLAGGVVVLVSTTWFRWC